MSAQGPSSLEASFAFTWHALYPDLPEPVPQHKGIEGRRFLFDFAWPEQYVAAELQGGTWSRGRHVRGAGYESDCVKLNLAIAQGWRVFYLTAGMLETDPERWLGLIAEAICQSA